MTAVERTVPVPFGNPSSSYNCSRLDDRVEQKTYTTVGERQDSFKCHPNIINLKYSPSDLAEEGFYYNGSQIVCAKCKGVLPAFSSWKKGEKLREVHKRLQTGRSRCPYTNDHYYESSSEEEEEDDDENEDNNDEVDGGHPGNKTRNCLQTDHLSADTGHSSTSCKPAERKSNTITVKDVKERLRAENERLRSNCRMCKEEKIQTLFLPCRHLITCEKCAESLDSCLFCNAAILGTVRTYMG